MINASDNSNFLEYFPNGNIRGCFVSSNANKQVNTSIYRFHCTLESPEKMSLTIAAKHVVLPYSFYQITKKRNVFAYTINGINKTIIIEPGNYNSDNICNSLNEAQPDLTFIISDITGKCSIATLVAETDFSIDYNNSTILTVFGYQNGFVNVTETSIIGLNSVDLNPVKMICIFVVSSNLSNFLHTGIHVNERRLLCSCVITNEIPFVNPIIYVDSNEKNYDNLMFNSMSFFDVRFTDQFGDDIVFQSGEFVLQLEFGYR